MTSRSPCPHRRPGGDHQGPDRQRRRCAHDRRRFWRLRGALLRPEKVAEAIAAVEAGISRPASASRRTAVCRASAGAGRPHSTHASSGQARNVCPGNDTGATGAIHDENFSWKTSRPQGCAARWRHPHRAGTDRRRPDRNVAAGLRRRLPTQQVYLGAVGRFANRIGGSRLVGMVGTLDPQRQRGHHLPARRS